MKINGIMCELEIVRMPDDLMDGCFGMYDHDKKKIYISDSIGLTQQEETVCHEIIHHIARTCGLELGEQTVNTLAYFLTKLSYKLEKTGVIK